MQIVIEWTQRARGYVQVLILWSTKAGCSMQLGKTALQVFDHVSKTTRRRWQKVVETPFRTVPLVCSHVVLQFMGH